MIQGIASPSSSWKTVVTCRPCCCLATPQGWLQLPTYLIGGMPLPTSTGDAEERVGERRNGATAVGDSSGHGAKCHGTPKTRNEHQQNQITPDCLEDHVVILILEALRASLAGHGENLCAQRRSNQIKYTVPNLVVESAALPKQGRRGNI
jgi:hypothetical protein